MSKRLLSLNIALAQIEITETWFDAIESTGLWFERSHFAALKLGVELEIKDEMELPLEKKV